MFAFGLLGYRDNSFLSLTVPDFLAMVDGAMFWQLESNDRLFEQQSIFVAHLMTSTGNLKKNTDLNKLRKGIYLPIEDRKKSVGSSKLQYVGKQKIEQLRDELKDRFNLH